MGRQLWIADKLRAYGVRTVEVSGWRTRGSSTFNPQGLVVHHTASQAGRDVPSLNICIGGRSDVPGPLCQVLLSRSGVAYVIASGRANHAGQGGYAGLSGNSSVLGIEAENNGVGEPWSYEQLNAYLRTAAALIDGANISVDKLCAHREWTSRKIDPTGIDMTQFRHNVALHVLGHGGAQPQPQPSDSNILRVGSRGAAVANLQNILNFWGYKAGAVDGIFGPGTEAAVKRYQSVLKVAADGVWGPTSQKAHDALMAYFQKANSQSSNTASTRPLLKRGDSGPHVKEAQRLLGSIAVDGVFGDRTYYRVIKFQKLNRLKPDGIIGTNTWAKLLA